MRFASVLLAFAAVATARFVMYADEWHPSHPTRDQDKAGITHIIAAFAFANNTAGFNASRIPALRSEFPQAEVMVAVGGWAGNGEAFMTMSKTDEGIRGFAREMKALLDRTGADGIDLDWEYPGGNGEDFPKVPNAKHAHEIAAFPKVVAAIRKAIGKDKLLSLAVPGKKVDMLAYTARNGPLLAKEVDFLNVMSYDLMNRRDRATAHHTSVAGSKVAINNYLAIGFQPAQLNLGFAFYAKYFTLPKGTRCSARAPLGCPIVAAENANGEDIFTSGAWTFERSHMVDASSNASALASYDGTCGIDKGSCATGCCSQYGNCGTSPQHCGNGCQFAFGTGCTGVDVQASFRSALTHGQVDDKSSAMWYIDPEHGLWWTWDSPALISRKFEQIVRPMRLGGVMAWSLGEDSFDWSRVGLIAKELQQSDPSRAAPLYGEPDAEPVAKEGPAEASEERLVPDQGDAAVKSSSLVDPASDLEAASSGSAPVVLASGEDDDEELVCMRRKKKRAFSA